MGGEAVKGRRYGNWNLDNAVGGRAMGQKVAGLGLMAKTFRQFAASFADLRRRSSWLDDTRMTDAQIDLVENGSK